MAINFHNSIKLNKNQLIQGAIENVLTDYAIAESVSGQMVYNTTDGKIKVFNAAANAGAGEWQVVGDTYTAGNGIVISNNVVSLKGQASMTNNVLQKWDSTNTKLVDSSIADDGTTVTISGNLTVTGTTTTVNTEEINLADNVILLNSNQDALQPPTEDAGIAVNRGNADNVSFIWDESEDYWSTVDQGFHIGSIPAHTATGTSTLLFSRAGEIEGQDFATALGILTLAGNTGAAFIGNTAVIAIAGTGAISTEAASNALTISVAEATDSVKGVVELATDTETITGTDASRATTPAGVAAALAGYFASKRHAANLEGDDATTTYDVQHDLATTDLTVQLFDTTSGQYVFADILHLDGNSIRVAFGSAVPAGTRYRVVIQA